MNPIQNIKHYFKYGKVVHRSPNGNVIRKKTDYSKLHGLKSEYVGTTKTILNKDGGVEYQLERNAYIGKDLVRTSFKPILYDKETGLVKPDSKQPRTKSYLINDDGKTLTDNTKPGYDYVYAPLPNGKTKYIIAYPETTIINKKEGTVLTTMPRKEVII